mgnify:CR=1 FL=1
MKKLIQVFLGLVFAAGLASCADIKSDPKTLPQDLVKRATETVKRFKVLPELRSFAKVTNEARAVVVLPSVIKAGFFGAAEAGHGLLLVKGDDGTWSYPAFYTLMAGSFGFQIGIQDVEIILVIRSEKALDAVIDYQAALGADAGITIGIFGSGVKASTTANLDADIVAFAHSKLGLFGGISLEGSVLSRRRDFNEAYYAPGATSRAIVLKRQHKNAGADILRAALASK